MKLSRILDWQRCGTTIIWIGLGLSATAYGQIEIRWITPSQPEPKLVAGQSLAISKPTSVRVLVTEVNDILYHHKIKLTLVPKVFNDAANLDIFKVPESNALGGAAPDCGTLPTLSNDLIDATKRYDAGKADAGKKYIPLDTTVTLLNNVKAALIALQKDSHYKDDKCRAAPIRATDTELGETILRLESRPHKVSADVVLDPAFDLKIEVSALWQADPNPVQVGPTYTVTVGVFTNQLSLSLGVLATTLEARTYSSRNSVVDGALAANRLVVENRGLRPTGVALLNYAVVGSSGAAGQDKFGLSISAGPTVGLGGGSASFGFFSGVTFRLWDRLFLTPGAHIGQFADFPAGLQNGAPIPTNYGALTVTNRWATRFGFAISFRTNDFSAAKKATPTAAAAK